MTREEWKKMRDEEKKQEELNMRLREYYKDDPEMLELLENDTDLMPSDIIVKGFDDWDEDDDDDEED